MERTLERLLLLSAMAISLVAFSGCDSEDGITEPTPETVNLPVDGAVDLVLASPNADDGGLLFSVSGGTVDSVTAAGYPLQMVRIGGTVKVLTVGIFSNRTTVARLWIPDVSKISDYSVDIQQVASRGTFAQRDPQTYRISLVRP